MGTSGSALLMGACSTHPVSSSTNAGGSAPGGGGNRLVLLGTRGGPGWSLDRRGISSALILGDQVYVIDCGDGAARQLALTLDPGLTDRRMFSRLRGVFLTHLHSDHIMDYFTLLCYGSARGLAESGPVPVYGPGRRGAMQPATAQQLSGLGEPVVINPANPTPGTTDMTQGLINAFALDLNDRVRDIGYPPLDSQVDPRDIALPAGLRFDPNDPQPPPMDPFEIHRDDRVRVTATLVSHFPVFPSFGYRFDFDGGAVVFSGDTGPSENLVRLAAGSDVLVHEVIDPDWVSSRPPASQQHHLTAHTSADDVGGIAASAGVGTLVLTHIVPGETPVANLERAGRGFPGELLVGHDGLEIPL
jgi:ribonuclease BN (tRNA processing enzyme)